MTKESQVTNLEISKRLGEWLTTRQAVENELSDKQPMFCLCGRLATGLHEMGCKRFKDRILKETIKRLEQARKENI